MPAIFEHLGKTFQLRIRNADDLRHVLELDEAHWVATSAPVETLNCDPTLLALLDSDQDGRIRVKDLRQAIAFVQACLRDLSGVEQRSSALSLRALDDDHPGAQRIARATRKMLTRVGRDESHEITLDDLRRLKRELEAQPVSEAGVVLPEASSEPLVRQLLADIAETLGGAAHPSGARGVDLETLERFRQEAEHHLSWLAEARPAGPDAQSRILPLGAHTDTAHRALEPIEAALDQYFRLCEAAVLDPDIGGRIQHALAAKADALAPDDAAAYDALLRSVPLARPTADEVLSFGAPISPLFRAALVRLREQALEPLLGCRTPLDKLSRAQWEHVKLALAPYRCWLAARRGEALEPLGPEKLQSYLAPDLDRTVRTLIGESASTALELEDLRLTEKLLLLQANLLQLVNNFVSFPDLYHPERRALFELGTLVMDSRRFNLALPVSDPKEHAKLAQTSHMMVIYAELTDREGRATAARQVALPVTAGGKGNLCLGKRGVFYDVAGREWDARIVDLIEAPTSVWEAVAAPFARLGRTLMGRLENLSQEAEEKLRGNATGTLTAVSSGEPLPAAQPGHQTGSLLAGGGIAVAALGSAAAFMTKTLAQIKWYVLLSGLLSLVAAVLAPTAIVALVRLRRRDLSAVVEGSGWAINARMRLSGAQRRFFSQRPPYPVVGLVRGPLIGTVLALLLAAVLIVLWRIRWLF